MNAEEQRVRRRPDTIRDLERRTVAHLAQGTTDLAAASLAVPASEYTDPQRFEAERRELFGKLPLLACLSLDVVEPGDSFTFDAAGRSILIVRGKDGKVRAFLNMCTHRGARLVTTCERRKLMVCPFHGWSFDTEGRLAAVPHKECFDAQDRAGRNLVHVPVGEYGGMIFVKAHAGEEEIDVQDWLGDMGPQLLALDLANAKPIKSDRLDAEANWKYCLDTFGEAYHLKTLHPTTFAQMLVPEVTLFDTFGPHQRVSFTNSHYREYVGKAESEWPEAPYKGSHLIFPNSIIFPASADGGVGLTRLFPGDSVGTCVTYMSMYRMSNAPEATTDQSLIDTHNLTIEIVRDEDYSVSKGAQHNLEHAPDGFTLVFGRNEPALQDFRRQVDRFIRAAET